ARETASSGVFVRFGRPLDFFDFIQSKWYKTAEWRSRRGGMATGERSLTFRTPHTPIAWTTVQTPAGPLTREAAVKVSRTMAYAVQALMQITDSTAGIPVSCHQLARDGRMPAKFLLQILRSLVAHG